MEAMEEWYKDFAEGCDIYERLGHKIDALRLLCDNVDSVKSTIWHVSKDPYRPSKRGPGFWWDLVFPVKFLGLYPGQETREQVFDSIDEVYCWHNREEYLLPSSVGVPVNIFCRLPVAATE
jgi:hypothetical protein